MPYWKIPNVFYNIEMKNQKKNWFETVENCDLSFFAYDLEIKMESAFFVCEKKTESLGFDELFNMC